MANDVEYALMAGVSYRSTRADINRFPIPDGWLEVPLSHVTMPSGFEAVSFQRGNEIVISFAGTAQLVDWLANIGLATGAGSDQLRDAAAYYLEIRNANPDAVITFTGHSLGGGLAALMGVLFNEKTVSFDPAPFRSSANNDRRDILLNQLAGLGYTQGSAIDALRSFTSSMPSTQPSEGGIRGEDGVRAILVAGEAVSESFLLAPFRPPIGAQSPPLTHGGADVSGVDLHSQALLAAFLQSEAFRQVSIKLPDMLSMVFSSNLYYHDPNDKENPERNFLENLVRHQAGIQGSIPADKMLDRFTADLQRVAQEGGLTLSNGSLTQALIAFAMQMYYENAAAAADRDKTLFTAVTGGIRFDRSDVAATLEAAKGYTLYFANYLASIPETERNEILQQLPDLLDWHLQAGRGGMTSTATTQRAFMLGGMGVDVLTGGTQNDLLVGQGGADRLIGGRGADILKGGAGEDTYVINTGDGHDRIEDTGRNYIKYNGKIIAGSFVKDPNGNRYTFLGDDGWTMQFNSPSVLTLDEDTSITFDNYTSAEAFEEAGYGIQLVDAPTPVEYTHTLQGDREWQVFYAPAELEEGSSPLPSGGPLLPGDEWIVTLNHPVNPQNPAWANWRIEQSDAVLVDQYDYLGWTVKAYRLTSATWAYNQIDELGNLVTTEQVAAASDRLTGSAENDRILAGENNDEVEALTGADRVELGNGDDHAEGGEGSDTLVGGAGRDVLFGEGGDDILHAHAELDPLAALTLGQSQSPQDGESGWLDGGEGDDRLFGDAGSDILLGGAGGDLILGGGGDDHLAGDDSGHEVPQYLRWLAYQVAHDVTADANGNRLHAYRYSTVNDVTRQAGGEDALYGGAGSDWLFGQGGDDYLDGGADADVAFGDEGDDTITGGEGDDFLTGDNLDAAGNPDNPGLPGALHGQDYIEGGAGADRIAGNGTLFGVTRKSQSLRNGVALAR